MKGGLYTVNIKIVSDQNSPVSNTIVILNAVSSKNKHQATTDSNGIAHFPSLTAGIYDAIVMMNGSKVGETIINVSGQNHVINFGINITGQKNNPLLRKAVLGAANASPYVIAGAIAGGILAGVVISILFIRMKGTRKVPA